MRDRLPLLLSTTALVVAVFGATPLGNAAYNAVVPKNSVGPDQLRKGAVTNQKLRGDAVTSGKVLNGTLKAIDFKAGQLPAGPKGDKGEKGPRGEKGDKGTKGDPGPAGLSDIEVVTALSASDSNNKSVSVQCPAGKKALGGGGIAPGYIGMILQQSIPLTDAAGWSIYVQESQPTTTTWAARVYAICAKVAT